MSPRQRIELAGWRGLCILMTAVDAILAIYFTFTPTSTFLLSPVWNGILGVTGTLQPVGWLFAIVAVAAIVGLVSSRTGLHWVLRFAFLAALVPWGAMLGSFVYAAWTLAGLGTMTAALSAVVLILHLATVGHFPAGQYLTRR